MVDLQIEQLGGQIGDGHEGRQRELFEKVFFTAAVPIENPTAAVSSSRLRTLGQIDRNGDGRLTKKEIKKGLALISPVLEPGGCTALVAIPIATC